MGDSDSEDKHQAKKINSPIELDGSSDNSSPPPSPKKPVKKFYPILLV